jgi:hypothetical protein
LGKLHDAQARYLKSKTLRKIELAPKNSKLLFERTALSKNSVELVKQELKILREEDKLTPDLVFP